MARRSKVSLEEELLRYDEGSKEYQDCKRALQILESDEAVEKELIEKMHELSKIWGRHSWGSCFLSVTTTGNDGYISAYSGQNIGEDEDEHFVEHFHYVDMGEYHGEKSN